MPRPAPWNCGRCEVRVREKDSESKRRSKLQRPHIRVVSSLYQTSMNLVSPVLFCMINSLKDFSRKIRAVWKGKRVKRSRNYSSSGGAHWKQNENDSSGGVRKPKVWKEKKEISLVSLLLLCHMKHEWKLSLVTAPTAMTDRGRDDVRSGSKSRRKERGETKHAWENSLFIRFSRISRISPIEVLKETSDERFIRYV